MKIRRCTKFGLFYRSVKTNLVSCGVSRNWCEIGSISIGSFEVILNLWIIWAAKVKYSISASRFPTQFRFPTENGQTLAFFLSYLVNCFRYKRVSVKNRILRTAMWKNFGVWRSLVRNYHSNKNLDKCSWNCPSEKKRSGLNTSGCGKSFGLCITAKRDAITIDPFFINVPSMIVSWMHKWGNESFTGRNLKFSSRTALK